MTHPTKNKKQRKTKNEKRHMHALKSALLLIVLNLLQFSDFQFNWVLKKTQQFFFTFFEAKVKCNPHGTSTHFQVRVRKVNNLNLPVFTAGPTSRRLHATLIASSLKVFTRIHAYCRGLYQVHSQ